MRSTKTYDHASSFSDSTVKKITFTGLFMAMTVAFSSFGIPVPGGHLYLCDIIICVASILLEPGYALIAAGFGSFLGDLFFYPTPMFVSLVTHGIQGAVISLIVRSLGKENAKLGAIIGVTVGAVVMVIGYTLGRAFIYATPEIALIKLPYEILQAAIGAVLGVILVFPLGMGKLFHTIFEQ